MTKYFSSKVLYLLVLISVFLNGDLFAEEEIGSVKTYTSSTNTEGLIGVTKASPIDNPMDNIFHVIIAEELCGDEKVWLVYELAGVKDHTSVSRGINDNLSVGGYLVKKSDGWKMQRELVDASWLRTGDNVIRFTIPNGASYNYRIRKLSIEVGQTNNEAFVEPELVINESEAFFYTYNNQTYIQGFVKGAGAEKVKITIDGAEIPVFKGVFETLVTNNNNAEDFTWKVRVEATYPDGQQICKEIQIENTVEADLQNTFSKNVHYTQKLISNTQASFIGLDGALLTTPVGALATTTAISVTSLRGIDIPALDAGMVNVTKHHSGYRFLPNGTGFSKEAKLQIAFDEAQIPDGYTTEDIRTYYFDEQAHHWIALRKDSVLAESGEIISKTTHFTDYINAIIKVPESPEVNAYNSTSMKGIKAANPTAAINLMQPPQANSMGNANMGYPINLPAGRNGMQPQVSINYSNGGGNSWMGLGWNLTVPSITIDTRWGVPRYDEDNETETYNLNGQQLSPVAHRGDLQPRSAEKIFHPRVEGAFQRIKRHGNNPSNYWWEVTDKSGTRYLYGGTHSGVFDINSVLRTNEENNEGSIAQWNLTEVIDLNGNFVRYHYVKVADAGIGDGSGAVKGYEIYCEKITYTGHGNQEGKYSVHFNRNEPRRKDVTIDARLGFKRVTADLLSKIEVKFDNTTIRHYEFGYEEGAFFKTLLKTITEFDAAGELFTTHELAYYDDVNAEAGYNPLKNSETWNPQDDAIETGLLISKAGFSKDVSVLSGNKSSNLGGGVTVTAGFNDLKLLSKSNTIGGSFGYSAAKTNGRTMLIDINGDGLSDKVFEQNGSLYYRANLSGPSGEVVFGEKINILNIENFYKDKSKTISGGFEANPGPSAFIGYSRSTTTTETTTYFTDANGDQLPDIIRNGQVLFNVLNNETGVISFQEDSDETPNPIIATNGPQGNIFEVSQEEIEAFIDQYPLHDMVRMWRAPYTGIIKVNAPVSLTNSASTNADGVRVAIQHNENELWSVFINATDAGTKTPSGVNNLSVQKGDQIYFRVQSVENGEDDLVNWAPIIEYVDKDINALDANSKPLYHFSSGEDFILSMPFEVAAPIDGVVKIQSNFNKPITTDDVQVEIIRKTESGSTIVEFNETYTWDEEVNIDINLEKTVDAGDNFMFKVTSSTNVDWTSLNWNPKLFYISSSDPNVPEVIVGGDTLILNYPIIEYSLFANAITQSEPWIIADSIESAKIYPQILFSVDQLPPNITTESGSIALSVKKTDSLLYKTTLSTQNDGTVVAIDTINIPVTIGDTLYIEYHLKNDLLAEAISSSDIYLQLADTTYTIGGSVYTIYSKEEDFIFGPLYRNWGQFGYNGNRNRANEPIHESDLKLSDKLKEEQNGSDISTPEELQAQDPYNPGEDNFIFLYPNQTSRIWTGYDDLTFISGTIMSSSRLGDDNILSSGGTQNTSGFQAINKKNKSTNNSIAAGAGGGFASGSATTSFGKSEQLTNYIDLNGDRYPDIFTTKGVVFTNSTGGLESSLNTGFHTGNISENEANGLGASINGVFKMTPKAGSTGGQQSKSDASDAKTSGSLGANGGSGSNNSQNTWVDINGDGLPDLVKANGNVALNLGYSLAPEEPWGHNAVQISESKSVGGGIGFTRGSGSESSSISLGVGVSLSSNELSHSLQDVNGDGLVDDLDISDGVRVRLNTGNGFSTDYISWTGADKINASSSTSESINASFTGCFPVFFGKLCINPSGNIGQGVSRDEKRISDIDGDGFPDFLQSNKDNNLTVKRSTIGRTNMLKTVNRPLGASFTVDYKREGNTYNQPNNIWTLSNVSVYDGFTGDGIDTLRTAFDYENGYYDRHEREFYGFNTVTTKTLDTGNGNALYTSVKQTFVNDNYYEKGLMTTEAMADAEGNKYVEKENTFVLKNTTNGADLPESIKESDNGVAYPALTKSNQKFYEGESTAGKTTSMAYEYSPIGNVTQYTDFGDAGTEDDLIATITYHNYDGPYVKGTPKSIVVEGTDRTYRKRETSINAATGNVTSIRQYLEDETLAVHSMEYDGFGNLTTIIRPANTNEERLSLTYEYDDIVNTYVTKTGNSYGYSSEATYDYRFGQVLESIDLNEHKISYVLDDLGRVTQITGPYEQQGGSTTIQFEYHPEAIVPWALTKHYDPANRNNFLETAIFVDGLGRVLQTKKDAAIYQGGNQPDKEMMIVSGRVKFDGLGRTVKAFYPVLEDTDNQGGFNTEYDGIDPTTTTYDVLNRAVTVTLPDMAITQTNYGFGSDRDSKKQFRTQTTDANGIITEQFTDVRGRVTAVKNITGDGDVWTSFSYNAINEQVAATDDQSNTTLSEYDWFGRRTQRIHPDAGQTNYAYDLAGNLTDLETANLISAGGAIEYAYEYERLLDITYPKNPENDVHYQYGATGAAHNRAGRIVVQEDATGAQEFFYGPLGEVIKNIRTIVIPQHDEQTFETQWSYDTWNRLESMTYPDGEEVTYNYNVGGLLSSMTGKKKGSQFNYVAQLGYDKFEQRVYLEYGNGTKTEYNYEPDRRRLATMKASTSKNRAFMDNVYTYDKVNNILGLTNNAAVPASNLMGGSSEYVYEYDDLYRLTSATGSYTGANEAHSYTLSMEYNTVGGITRKNQQHLKKEQVQKKTTYDMAYEYTGSQPHAPNHIGDQTFAYDANGNQTGWRSDISGQRRDLLWDEENRIRAISDNGAVYHYIYDASGTRVLKGQSNGQSIYVDGKYKTGSGNMGNYTIYVNPYIVLKRGGYTKHYYIEGQRIVSKLGGGLDGNGNEVKAGLGGINYSKKHDELFEGIVRNLKWLADDGSILTAGKSGKVPPGQVLDGAPGNSGDEKFQFYYHPDHLGSTSYITDASGEVYQHLEYFAFGETFVEEHSNTDRTPYLFNGKELDEETGLYYYGARYYDPVTSIFPSVDPMAEKFPDWSPYTYAFNNPIRFIDPTGMEGEDGVTDPPTKEQKAAMAKAAEQYGALSEKYATTAGKINEGGGSDGQSVNQQENTMTPWDVGVEWLTGKGPKNRNFTNGDAFTEMLRQHDHVGATKSIIVKQFTNGVLSGDNPYSLGGVQGVGKYLKDYSTLATGGATGNLAVTYLGSYGLHWDVTEVNGNMATVVFSVQNSSTIQSATRPPILGYTSWWQSTVGPWLNQQLSNGPMSPKTQTFKWTENIQIK